MDRGLTKNGGKTLLTESEVAEYDARQIVGNAAVNRRAKEAYKQKRIDEYPPMGDQLDIIWKEMSKKAAGGESYSDEAVDMLTEIMGVKTKYPKPSDE